MASGGPFKTGSESQDSDEPAPPGTSGYEHQKPKPSPLLYPTTKGVENAKKRLRAFAIQKKKAPVAFPLVSAKPASMGNATVLIGKLTSVKTTPKAEKLEDESKKQPKPPKPGTNKKYLHESYTDLQKKTLAEIEDMKRKMELVDLGIPLGLICPSTNEKAMPTKAMPPIKSFLDPSKVDELIREAKKARAEGREYKFDYHKLLPDYDNPFQRKKEDVIPERKDIAPEVEIYDDTRHRKSKGDRERRTSERYDRRHEYKKDDKAKFDKTKEKDNKSKEIDCRSKDKEGADKNDDKSSENLSERDGKETDLNLNDYVVCDSWSLDNDEKNSSSPQVEDKAQKVTVSTSKDGKNPTKDPMDQLRESYSSKKNREKPVDSSKIRPIKIEKLKPVIDSFKFEIDPNDDEVLDMFDENSELEKYSQRKPQKDNLYNSPIIKFDYDRDTSKDTSMDCINDDKFLESVINEIKQETMSDDESQDKGLVEYDSPSKEYEDGASQDPSQGSVTPELDYKVMRYYDDSSRSHDSGRKSIESCKSVESGYKSNESYKDSRRSNNFHLTMEKEEHEPVESKMLKSTVTSLETWSFVLKICQPLLFRHDKNKCYKETRATPKLWYTESPKLCSCVKDRTVVYEELEMCKMKLVNRLYGCEQVSDPPPLSARAWYPRADLCLAPAEDAPRPPREPRRADPGAKQGKAQRWSMTPERSEEVEVLDREYQRFMEAVWPEVTEPKPNTSRSTTPVRQEVRKMAKKDKEDDNKKEKIKLSVDGWSQESDLEEEVEKSKKQKVEKVKMRKRKRSVSSLSSVSDSEDGAKKKKQKKKANKKAKTKLDKASRLEKKILLKLKEKSKTKKRKIKIEESELDEEMENETKKKEKLKKKKQQKIKKKAGKKKKKKAKAKSSSSSDSSSSSESSSDSESEVERRAKKAKRKEEEARKKRKKEKKKKRKKSTSDSEQSEELFDMNVLNNIKTERLTDEEKPQLKDQELRKHREIINVKELHEDFSSHVQVKQELEADAKRAGAAASARAGAGAGAGVDLDESREPQDTEPKDQSDKVEFKEPQDILLPAQQIRPVTDESNLSQCSSQESVCSVKDAPAYEKDESHLRPSSQNSNYSFNDVISASQSGLYPKGMEEEEKFENYEHGNYEMYEQLAMAYQSDVASQQISLGEPTCSGEQRIETVVRARSRGEIKCDWRAGDAPSPPRRARPHRPSRWGLKPGEVNIVLTGGGEASPEPAPAHPPSHPPSPAPAPVYQIQSLANRTDNSASGYDEAYADMYGAADRLQYGDCFSTPAAGADAAGRRSLDARINQALRNSVLGEVANETSETDNDAPERGILVTKSLGGRAAKRVSFADGYKPGQDSDTEGPPVKKKKKSRRVGCAWPCPATHADHVPLWDALPPPPPPPGSPPPPPAARAPPLHLLRAAARPAPPALLPPPPHVLQHKFDPSGAIPNFMPPEPPPGLLSFP